MNENNVSNGSQFESVVHHKLIENKPKTIIPYFKFEDIGISVDFLVDWGDIIECVEAKGGEKIKDNGDSWSGAARTDNVKKAICNGSLLKAAYPEHKYTVYFNQPPKNGSSSYLMLKCALRSGIIDKVIILSNNTESEFRTSDLYVC